MRGEIPISCQLEFPFKLLSTAKLKTRHFTSLKYILNFNFNQLLRYTLGGFFEIKMDNLLVIFVARVKNINTDKALQRTSLFTFHQVPGCPASPLRGAQKSSYLFL